MIPLPPHPIKLADVAMARAFNGSLDKQSWSLDSARLHARPQEASHEQTGPGSCPHGSHLLDAALSATALCQAPGRTLAASSLLSCL